MSMQDRLNRLYEMESGGRKKIEEDSLKSLQDLTIFLMKIPIEP